MAQPLDVKRLLASGRQLTETGRQLGTDLVEQGRQATDQISAVVEHLVNPVGRERVEDLRQMIRGEVQQPLRTLGSEIREHLATQSQLVGDRIASAVDDVRDAVRDEVQRQMSTLGLATREDLAALGRTIGDDLSALEPRAFLATRTTTPTAAGDAPGKGTGSEDSALQGAAVQVTPPHQRATVIDPPTS